MGRGINFCHIDTSQVGEILRKYAGAADDKTAVVLRRFRQGFRCAVYNRRAVDLHILPGDDDVMPLGQRPSAGEVLQGLPAHDDRVAGGQFPEPHPVRRDHQRLRALRADAPIAVNRYDCVHGLHRDGDFAVQLRVLVALQGEAVFRELVKVRDACVHGELGRGVLGIFQDITKEEEAEKQSYQLKVETIEMAQAVIDRQRTVAQEIAGLLGETTAETKVTLTKLRDMILGEETDIQEGIG